MRMEWPTGWCETCIIYKPLYTSVAAAAAAAGKYSASEWCKFFLFKFFIVQNPLLWTISQTFGNTIVKNMQFFSDVIIINKGFPNFQISHLETIQPCRQNMGAAAETLPGYCFLRDHYPNITGTCSPCPPLPDRKHSAPLNQPENATN